MKSKLDKDKLNRLLRLHDRNYSWLAKKLNWTRQRMHYHIKNKTVMCADVVAPLFGLKGKDLIK
jgi:hypothetical protein